MDHTASFLPLTNAHGRVSHHIEDVVEPELSQAVAGQVHLVCCIGGITHWHDAVWHWAVSPSQARYGVLFQNILK